MPVSDIYLNESINGMRSKITHIGLVDDEGDELTGGDYARQPVTWTEAPTDDEPGVIRPTADLVFDVPEGTVAGWCGFSTLIEGNSYGGEDFTKAVEYDDVGELVLKADETAYRHKVNDTPEE